MRAGLGTAAALVAAVAGIFIATNIGGEGVKGYTLNETLPQMVSDFGAATQVVEISVAHDNVDYKVIPRDGQLHIRNYDLVQYEIQAGTAGYNRKVTNVVRAPTAGETSQAHATLGQIDPEVTDRLLHKVGFSRNGSSARLDGLAWVLESVQGPSNAYIATLDGGHVHRVNGTPTP